MTDASLAIGLAVSNPLSYNTTDNIPYLDVNDITFDT